MSSRIYVVGLPVVVTIFDDGFTSVDVDTSELASAKVLAEHSEHSEEQVQADAEHLRRWVQRHTVQGQG